ncbi:MAG: hypothetical protein HKN44_05160 [Ilumatobacter sp.]|nr:hypothetical protein [Ilumatobacter sp.]
MTTPVVRAPASSANLGAGFDVLGMALDLCADCGVGDPPPGAEALDQQHPAATVFGELGGVGPIWIRHAIPMARGLGFSGSARVAAAALAVVQRTGGDHSAITEAADEILAVAARHEGHGDNVAASVFGGITAYVDGRAVQIPVGPTLAAASFVAWIPDLTTSTDTSRRALPPTVDRADAIHNIARSIQFVTAIAHDDPTLLADATDDRLHQAVRLEAVPGGAEALDAGVAAGAWCGWLSGSGPTIGLLCDALAVDAVVAALPGGGHAKVLAIDTIGVRPVDG